MSKTRKNALLSVSGRNAMVESVLIDKLTKVSVAKKFNVAHATAGKWVIGMFQKANRSLRIVFPVLTQVLELPQQQQWRRSSQ